MRTVEADTVIIGSGLAGVLVARELASPAHPVAMVERGSFLSWEEQIRRHESGATLRPEGDGEGSVHNDENAPDGVDWVWEYVYGVGGTCNHWIGTCPRFLPEDFEMRSRYGVMTDWPLSYEDLAPYYALAERALGVSGARSGLTPGADPPLPPHPLSPQDRAVARHLRPFIPLAQARPSRAVGARPACCGSTRCELCPVDSRFSVLNGLGEVLERPGLRLLTETIAARLEAEPSGGRIAAVECVAADGSRTRLRGDRFVVAANAIESAGLLLRSEIDDPDTGRYFASRDAITLLVSTREPVGPGYGASRSTGASYAYYSGDFRARRGAALLSPENLGDAEAMLASVVDGVVDRRDGETVRRDAVDRWERTLALSVVVEDEPSADNAVTLSPTRDRFGIPLNRVRYVPGEYANLSLEHLVKDVPRRLRALGAGDAELVAAARGGHLLGTLRMGSGSEGVVDSSLRHRRFDNLFVSGGAVFPTYAATYPTLTIAALAIRLGRMLAGGAG
jgi:glucose dehydrogenase